MAVNRKIKRVDRHYYKGDNDLIFKSRTLTFMPYVVSDANVSYLIKMIRDALSPKLLKLDQRKRNLSNPLYGHCYHATQALYYLLDYPENIYKIYKGIDDENEYHWWLQKEEIIYDITAGRYLSEGKTPPYEKGFESFWKGPKRRPLEETLDLMICVIKNDRRKYTDIITMHESDQQFARDF